MNFESALGYIKLGKKVSRGAWGTNVHIEAQIPDENSKMTIPYLFMTKRLDQTAEMPAHTRKFPCDLSCESIFAEDWKIVD